MPPPPLPVPSPPAPLLPPELSLINQSRSHKSHVVPYDTSLAVYPPPKDALERLTAIGGPPPSPETKVTMVGNSEIYRWESLVGPFLVHKLLGPRHCTVLHCAALRCSALHCNALHYAILPNAYQW